MQAVWESLPLLLKGAGMTLKIALLAGAIGLVLGTLIGLGRSSGNKFLSGLLRVYVEILRGTPVYTQLLIIVYGIPTVMDVQINEFVGAVLTIGINSSAYVSEIIRAGVQSIDKGQMEAARSMGMSRTKAMVYIILPQAIKRVIPPLLNELVTLIKESSLVAAIALVELTRTAQQIGSRTYKPFPPLVAAAAIYLIINLTLSLFAERLEGRLRASD